ncbi:hypothetical protein SB85_09275 [Xanthomonas sacchari]|nr:hypothetical protein SB85_09275 [Xanthomonas sacchari]
MRILVTRPTLQYRTKGAASCHGSAPPFTASLRLSLLTQPPATRLFWFLPAFRASILNCTSFRAEYLPLPNRKRPRPCVQSQDFHGALCRGKIAIVER